MKKMKKWAVLFLCVLTLGCMTGCGNRDNSVDGADRGTTNTTDKGDGVMDDAVHDVTDGINDVTDDLTDGDVRSEQTR